MFAVDSSTRKAGSGVRICRQERLKTYFIYLYISFFLPGVVFQVLKCIFILFWE